MIDFDLKLLSISLAEEKDLKPLAEMYIPLYERADIGENWSMDTALNFMKWWLQIQPDFFLVARYRGIVVGAFVALVKMFDDGPRLSECEVFVREDLQGNGIGAELAKSIYKNALSKGIKRIELNTYKTSDKEHPYSWWKSQGFRVEESIIPMSNSIDDALSRL